MNMYTVHFSGYYGYDVEVEAENEEQAKIVATPIFEDADSEDFIFIPDAIDVMEK